VHRLRPLASAAWCAYGIAADDIYLIVPNVVGVISNVTSVFVVHRYRHRVDPGRARV